MAVTIGLPRALLHYYYGAAWTHFFHSLGARVIVSGETTKLSLDQGKVVDEVCMPLKIYFGHVAELSPQVDYIFAPRLVSMAGGEYNCPKIIGLPDLLRSRMEHLPKLIDVTLSLRQSRLAIYQAVIDAGRAIGANALRSLCAWRAACRQGPAVCQACENNVQDPRIAVIGHPYLIQDRQASLGLLDKVGKLGAIALTPDRVPPRLANRAAAVFGKTLYWTHGRHLLGAAAVYMQQQPPVDGVIFMTSFSCGPDSIISELIKQYANKLAMPFLLLSIDEHTAEAGLATRLEAFIDMLIRRAPS